jgi:hypothetical protein
MEALLAYPLPVGTVAVVSAIFLGNILPLAMIWAIYRYAEKSLGMPRAVVSTGTSPAQELRIPPRAA